MAAYPHIERYYSELSQLIEFGGLANEENIRSRSRIVWRPTVLSTLNDCCSYRSCGQIEATSLMEPSGTPCA